MSIKDRIRRLENGKGGPRGRCPVCNLSVQEKGYIVCDGNDPVPHLPEVCPVCGRYTRLHIVVVYEGDEVEEEPGDYVWP